MMLIRWLTIIFVLVSGFILVYSRALLTSHEEDQQWTGSAIDSVNDGIRQEEPLSPSFNTSAIEASIKTQKVPVHLDCQEAIDHRRDIEREASSKKKDYQNQFSRCKDYQKNARMIAALSKIAKVRVAGGDPVITARRLEEFRIDDATRRKSTYLLNNDNAAGNTLENTKVTSITSLQLSSNGISNHAANNENKQRSIRCRAKGDIYITDVNENVPSYTCKLGNNVFLLASKRFWRDRRNNLNVSVDDDTLRRLNNASFTSTENNSRIIEVVLALKSDGEDYEIRNR